MVTPRPCPCDDVIGLRQELAQINGLFPERRERKLHS